MLATISPEPFIISNKEATANYQLYAAVIRVLLNRAKGGRWTMIWWVLLSFATRQP